MAIIYSYPTTIPADSDLVVIVDTSKPGKSTKTALVKDLRAYVKSDTVLFNNVGMRMKTGTTANADYAVTSPRSDGWFSTNTVKYTKFNATFENLILEEGSTYKLILERWKKGDGDVYKRSSVRTSSFKKQSLLDNSASLPYSDRPVEIAITSVTGQIFDFRPDLYYSASAVLNSRFPRPSGYSKTTHDRVASTQHMAFRISKTTEGVTQLSSIVAKVKLIGARETGTVGQFNSILWKFY